jgi:hypothetical protein
VQLKTHELSPKDERHVLEEALPVQDQSLPSVMSQLGQFESDEQVPHDETGLAGEAVQDRSLTCLIGQLVQLETVQQLPKSETDLLEEALPLQPRSLSSLIGQFPINHFNHADVVEIEVITPTVNDVPEEESNDSSAEVPMFEDEPLTALIGQLLKLKSDDHVQTQEQVSDSTSSTHLSENADITDSDVGTLEPTILSPSGCSSFHDSCDVSDENWKAHPQVRCKEVPSGNHAKNWQRHNGRMTTESQQDRAAYLASVRMNQCKMAHMQMAHAAQVAKWQREAYAFHAQQTAQFRAMQGVLQ